MNNNFIWPNHPVLILQINQMEFTFELLIISSTFIFNKFDHQTKGRINFRNSFVQKVDSSSIGITSPDLANISLFCNSLLKKISAQVYLQTIHLKMELIY